MDAIAKFKEAAMALQQDERYLKLAAARKANDDDETLQNMIGEFNLVRLDLNNEIEKEDRDDARVTELNEKINQLYNGIMNSETMLAYNDGKIGDANALYKEASGLADRGDLRVLNGLYLTSWQLGQRDAAQDAFGRLVASGLEAR